MNAAPSIRKTTSADWPLLQHLYPASFPEEDLLPVVEALITDRNDVLSLAAFTGETMVGHVAFTQCGVEGSDIRVGLLAPLCAAPSVQKQGIGTALVRTGFQLLKDDFGISMVYVLGDPDYYGRFGFASDTDVAPPYPLPEEYLGAWQSLCLADERPVLTGKLLVPPPWQQEKLWSA